MSHSRPPRWGWWATVPLASLCCSAGVFVDTSPGSGAPPGTLGGYLMTPSGDDPRPEGSVVTTAPTPLGDLRFHSEVELETVGSQWHTWSHGYAGDVYYTIDGTGWVYHDLTFDLPAGTLAFHLYVEPNLKWVDGFPFEISGGTASESRTVNLQITGLGGAEYIGFWSDDPSQPLTQIRVNQPREESDGFAVGEFGLYVIPEPAGAAALAALGLVGWGLRRKSHRS